jgi:hypothetical protein
MPWYGNGENGLGAANGSNSNHAPEGRILAAEFRPSSGVELTGGRSVGEIQRGARILVAGRRGLVGSAIVKLFQAEGIEGIRTATRNQLDLRDRAGVISACFIRTLLRMP